MSETNGIAWQVAAATRVLNDVLKHAAEAGLDARAIVSRGVDGETVVHVQLLEDVTSGEVPVRVSERAVVDLEMDDEVRIAEGSRRRYLGRDSSETGVVVGRSASTLYDEFVYAVQFGNVVVKVPRSQLTKVTNS